MSKLNAILEAATLLFSRNGFKQTSMAELSEVTGAARGTIFHHFKNKEDLFIKVLHKIQKSIITAFNEQQKKNKYTNGLEMVEAAVEFYLNLTIEKEDQFLMLHRHFPYQIAESNPKCRDYLESIYNCLVDIFENAINQGIKDGSIKVSSSQHTAMLLFAMVDGVARLNTYRLYHTGSLYNDLIISCRNLLNGKKDTLPDHDPQTINEHCG